MHTHTLVRHRDIQNWVSTRQGQPAIRRVPDRTGMVHARLAINFPKRIRLTETPSQDDGMAPCSWSAWLAELDRQQLALRVADTGKSAFEFVPRRELN